MAKKKTRKTTGKNPYDNLCEGMSSLNFIRGYLEEIKKKEEQTEKLKSAIFGPAKIRDSDKEPMFAEVMNDPKKSQRYVGKHLEELEKRLEEVDYNAVIDSTPRAILSKLLHFIPYNEGGINNTLLRDYHAFLNLSQAMGQAKNDGKADELEKLEEKLKGLAMDRFKASYEDSDDYTKQFITEFADKASDEFKGLKINQYLKEASAYVSDSGNEKELKDYLKTDIAEDKKTKALEIIATIK